MGRAFLLTLQFDGTDFRGWQRQREGPTVQAEVERVLSRLAGTSIKAIAAGRTDAGVHALGLPVSATLPAGWTAAALLRALNSLLPASIAVRRVQAVHPGADARRHATHRRYRYEIGTSANARSPFTRRVQWPLARRPDFGALQRVAVVIHGEHDFRGFAATGEPKPHYRCRIIESNWTAVAEDRFSFTIAADRFLHHMVRFLVGTMVEIGLNRRAEEEMVRLLERTGTSMTAPPAPACGLTFISAGYPSELFLEDAAEW